MEVANAATVHSFIANALQRQQQQRVAWWPCCCHCGSLVSGAKLLTVGYSMINESNLAHSTQIDKRHSRDDDDDEDDASSLCEWKNQPQNAHLWFSIDRNVTKIKQCLTFRVTLLMKVDYLKRTRINIISTYLLPLTSRVNPTQLICTFLFAKKKRNKAEKEHTDRDRQITYYTKLTYTITLKIKWLWQCKDDFCSYSK